MLRAVKIFGETITKENNLGLFYLDLILFKNYRTALFVIIVLYPFNISFVCVLHMKARNVFQHAVPILNLSEGALGSHSHLLQRFKSISQGGSTEAVTVLGVDVGTRHVGLAVSDAGGKIAFPLRGFRRTDVSNDVQQLRKAVSETSARAAVVGVPNILYPRRAVLPTPVRDFILAYATKVLPLSGVRVVGLCDENFSSSIAREGVRQSVSTRFWNDPVLRKRAVDAVRFFLFDCYGYFLVFFLTSVLSAPFVDFKTIIRLGITIIVEALSCISNTLTLMSTRTFILRAPRQ